MSALGSTLSFLIYRTLHIGHPPVRIRSQLQLTPSMRFMLCVDQMKVYSGASQRSALNASVGINASAMRIVCSRHVGMHATQRHSIRRES
jgi:hypothetical protein